MMTRYLSTLLMVLAFFSGGCRSSGNSALAALIATPIALGSSVVSRAVGGCYASCTPGTVCNPRTGLCDALPCDGRCGPNEWCERRKGKEECVPRGGNNNLRVVGDEDAPTTPALPPTELEER